MSLRPLGQPSPQTPPLSDASKQQPASSGRKRKRDDHPLSEGDNSSERHQRAKYLSRSQGLQSPKSPLSNATVKSLPSEALLQNNTRYHGHTESTINRSDVEQVPGQYPHVSELENPSGHKSKSALRRSGNSLEDHSTQEEDLYACETRAAHVEYDTASYQGDSVEIPDPVGQWALDGTWPEEYFTEEHTMNAPLTKKRSASTMRDPSMTTSESNASAKERQYQSPRFETLLQKAGIYMKENPVEPSQSCKELCGRLLEAEQELPKDSLFNEEAFRPVIARLENENEATVVRDMTPLVAPPAELLYLRGAKHLRILHGHVNRAWHRSVPLVAPPPQPDYCVGLSLYAFDAKRDQRLEALIADKERNPLMATWQMYFPFFMCEVKAANEDLNAADRQNMSSCSVAVNSVVALYRAAGREKELHGKILAFSIAHNTEQFRIYGYYASFSEQVPRFYRYKIKSGLFETGQDRWQTFTFTRNVYDIYAPMLYERVCSVLDFLPMNASIWGPELTFQPSDTGDSRSVQSSAPRAPESVTTPAADE